MALALLALCSGAGIAADASSPITTVLTVDGSVAQSLSLTVADLKRYPTRQIDYAPGRGTEGKASNEPPTIQVKRPPSTPSKIVVSSVRSPALKLLEIRRNQTPKVRGSAIQRMR